MAKYTAEISVPTNVKGLLKPDTRSRGMVKIKSGKTTNILIESDDMAAFKATLNSVVRDLTVIDSSSKAAKRS